MKKISKNYKKNCKRNCKKVINQLEIYAMMRSGQHAIIYWLFDQIKSPIYFHNDILCYNGEKAYLDRGRWMNAGARPPVKIFPWYAYNIEDISIRDIDKIKKEYKKALYIVPPKRERRVLIIRDPFNLFASRYRFFYRINKLRAESGKLPIKPNHKTNRNSQISWYQKDAIERWKEYAREAVGETNYLGDNKVIINYNHWFKHERVRKEISKNMGIDFSDSKLNFVPENGYGSSFDSMEMNGKAQQMKVLERWKRLYKTDEIKRVLGDPELIRLSLLLWPVLTKEVIKELRLIGKKTREQMGL